MIVLKSLPTERDKSTSVLFYNLVFYKRVNDVYYLSSSQNRENEKERPKKKVVKLEGRISSERLDNSIRNNNKNNG